MTFEDKADLIGRIQFSNTTNDFSDCQLVIEAIVEDINVKKQVFKNLESIVSNTTILASNTSSLSIASIGAALNNPSRIIGIHFFNPAPLMPLVEIIPAVQTSKETL
jgi:3-hydroxybutyryl-CoA dehydrogenase